MPPRKSLNLRNERLDSAGSSHRNDRLGSCLLRSVPMFRQPSDPVLFGCHSVRTHAIMATVAVIAPSSCRIRSSLPVAPRESPYYWVLSLTQSPKSEPIKGNRARRPVARDSNNRSLIQQLSWILWRLFLTFMDPSHNSLVLSGVRNRILHKSRFGFRSSKSFEEVLSAAFRLFCKVMAINKVQLSGRGRRRRYNLNAVTIHRMVLTGSLAAILFCSLITPLG